MAAQQRTKRINLRATAYEDELIREVAHQFGMNITDFVLQSARTQAEQALANKRQFSVPPDVWKKFSEALDRPAAVKQRLRKLFSEPSVLENR